MASSRKSKPSRSSSDLAPHVIARLKTVVKPGDSLVLGLSGGVDSMVLLDVLARLAKRLRFTLQALHVNHQLSPHALRWARFCREACRERGIACRITKVALERGNSVERAARDARYAALYRMRAQFIVLAHTEDDQAETVLLQLLRGGGVKGLSAMPLVRRGAERSGRAEGTRRYEGGGMRDEGRRRDEGGGMRDEETTRAAILRPFLDVSRDAIERYARARKLAWIEDESNLDTHYLRNWLRVELLPRVAQRVPAYRSVLARAARHFGEAGRLLDDLARIDLGAPTGDGVITVARLSALSGARAKNVLRFVIASRGWTLPEAQRLEEALRQALTAKSDAAVAVNLGDCILRRHGGAVYVLRSRQAAAGDAVITWHGEREIALPGPGGVLVMAQRCGAGLSASQLQSQRVTIRPRHGGERLQPDADRPRRTVKNLLQEARMPPWQRERLPYIYCGERLACVPGVAIDHRFQAGRGEASILPVWREA